MTRMIDQRAATFVAASPKGGGAPAPVLRRSQPTTTPLPMPTSAPTPGPVEAPAHHEAHLAHHYETPQQQYEAAKLGMWLFLGTELLLFGGLFCLYAVFRARNPELFAWGAQYLSTTMGAINTIVLILSSMTIAFAVRCAQLNQRRRLAVMLALTFLGGGIFMGIKYVEYSEKFEKNLVWGLAFYERPDDASRDAPAAVVKAGPAAGDPEMGRQSWMNTCLACHGQRGEGVRGQAFDFRESGFVEESSDEDLLAFIKGGRMPFDPANRTGVQMPPKGGNPLLSDDDLRDIVAYIRTFDLSAVDDEPADDLRDIVAGEVAADTDAAREELLILKSSLPPPVAAPRGLAEDWEAQLERRGPGDRGLIAALAATEPPHPLDDPDRPANAHVFFGVYFLMTGLHGLHVLVGMGVIGVLTILAWRGAFTSAYHTPVELTGLYWHVVDLIWIFLFPLFYLIA